jgi:hypothetical protein
LCGKYLLSTYGINGDLTEDIKPLERMYNVLLEGFQTNGHVIVFGDYELYINILYCNICIMQLWIKGANT